MRILWIYIVAISQLFNVHAGGQGSFFKDVILDNENQQQHEIAELVHTFRNEDFADDTSSLTMDEDMYGDDAESYRTGSTLDTDYYMSFPANSDNFFDEEDDQAPVQQDEEEVYRLHVSNFAPFTILINNALRADTGNEIVSLRQSSCTISIENDTNQLFRHVFDLLPDTTNRLIVQVMSDEQDRSKQLLVVDIRKGDKREFFVEVIDR